MKQTVHGISGRQTVCHVLLFLGLFAFQAIKLDSDPSPLTELYQFDDEGYWNHSARCRVLFGTFVPDEFNQGIIASPLFTLIQWAVFSLTGVSIYSARLLPLVSLWLILLMVYFLVKRHSSAKTALLAVALLGLMHELLMYTKWSTPIITQACFLTAILWFWEYGKTGSRWWLAACGACLVAATLTTLLTIHCIPGILLFLGVACCLRKEVDGQRIAVFLGVALFLGMGVAVAYYVPNLDQVQIFWRTIGDRNFGGNPYAHTAQVGQTLQALPQQEQTLQALPFLELFCSPGVVPLTMLVSLWFLDFLTRMGNAGLGVVLRQMSSVELYCLCWVIGAMPSIIATPLMPARRFVIFLVPLVVLSTFFIWRVWNTHVTGQTSPSPGLTGQRGLWRLGFRCLVAASWCVCLWTFNSILLFRWLIFAGLGTPLALTVLVWSSGGVIAGLYFLSQKTKVTIVLLLICFFAVNLSLTGIWYSYAKGRLQHEIGSHVPKSLQRNYCLRGIGAATRSVVERYVADQLGHHRMADPNVQQRLTRFQESYLEVELGRPSFSSHGEYWCNLHVVFVSDERWMEIREEVLEKRLTTIAAAAAKHGHRLSRAAFLPDHAMTCGYPHEL